MQITSAEQYLLELINRARLDPLAEAERLGIDLNQGLSPGQISTDAKQPLGHDDLLANASEAHSDWIIATNTFSHTGVNNSTPGDRMEDAGYVFSGIWTWGENLAWYGTTGQVDLEAAIEIHNDGLFLSAGHRANTLHPDFREIGIAQVQGPFTHTDNVTYDASVLTEKFAKSGSDIFLTGAAYDDANEDDFYSIGEGTGGLSFAIGQTTTTSAEAGGYKLAIGASNAVDLKVTGPGGLDVDLLLYLSDENAKLDIVDGSWAFTSADLTLISGLDDARLLGVEDRHLTGNDADNRLVGNKGDNFLLGGGGDDLIMGGAGADVLQGEGGNDTAGYVEASAGVFVRLWSGEGLSGEASGDILTGIENLRGSAFTDTLVGDGSVNHLAGGGGADALWAGDGDDILMGGAGADLLNGQGGSDTASYAEADGGVFVRLWSREGLSGEALGDVLNGIENLEGSAFGDTLVGDNSANRLSGGGGSDALWAGDGDDILIGGAGADLFNGQGGSDTFVFQDGTGTDTIADWQDGLDRLSFDIIGFGGFGDVAVEVVGNDTLVSFGDATALLLNWQNGVNGTINEFDFV